MSTLLGDPERQVLRRDYRVAVVRLTLRALDPTDCYSAEPLPKSIVIEIAAAIGAERP